MLVLGSTGQIGKLGGPRTRNISDVHLRLSSRRLEAVEELSGGGEEAIYLDLDNPKTFALALAGVDRVSLLTGYTIAMVMQSKTFVDAAEKAGVKHVVHLGFFGEWDTTDPHFVWHQLIESYVKASGLAWTNLHPNVFNDILFNNVKADQLTVYWESRRLVACVSSR